MTVDSETSADPRPARVPPSASGKPDAAGLMLRRLTLLPVLFALSFLLVSFPLLLLGWFRPVPVLLLWAVAAVIIVPLGWRLSAASAERAETGAAVSRTPWWPVVALVLIAIGFGLFQAAYYGQLLYVSRDPASYMNFAIWIQGHGSLPIAPSWAPFGGIGSGHTKLWITGWAYYGVGDTIVPQFMAGLPMALSVGYWIGGLNGAFLMAPLLGAAALVTFGGLVARLVGPRWAPIAALGLALTLPMFYTSRETFSEPLSEIVFLGGLCLLIDALRARAYPAGESGGRRVRWPRPPRTLAALAGLSLGSVFLVRLDGPSDILLLVPYCGLLFLQRKPQAVPLAIGAFVGLVYGAVDALVLTRPYALVTNGKEVKPLAEIFAAVAVLTVAGVLVGMVLRRRRGVPSIPAWIPNVATVLPVIVIAGFAARPYIQKNYVQLQEWQFALHWVYWYAGGPVIVAGTLGAGLLLRRLLQGRHQEWVAPFCVLAWSMCEFLYLPAIIPNQPWGSRRLVPAVLPGFFLFAVWFGARVMRWVAGGGLARVLRRIGLAGSGGTFVRRGVWGVLVAVSAVCLLVPPAKTTFNLKLQTKGGVHLTADGFATKRLYVGEPSAFLHICSLLPAHSAVLFPDLDSYGRMGEDIRGLCNVPVASLQYPSRAHVDAVMDRIKRAGWRPILLGSTKSFVNYPNGDVKEVVALNSLDDQSLLGRPPTTGSRPLYWSVWMWEGK
jgi:hypothetical protein